MHRNGRLGNCHKTVLNMKRLGFTREALAVVSAGNGPLTIVIAPLTFQGMCYRGNMYSRADVNCQGVSVSACWIYPRVVMPGEGYCAVVL